MRLLEIEQIKKTIRIVIMEMCMPVAVVIILFDVYSVCKCLVHYVDM